MTSHPVARTSSLVVAIHQPNFLPWLGYFDKIQRSDVFIFLDDVQLPKTGGTWSNRVKMLCGDSAKWVTVPIDRAFHGVRKICEMEFQRGVPWREKTIDLVAKNYRNAPFFEQVMEVLHPIILNSDNNIAAYNAHAIISIAGKLGIGAEKFRWSSELPGEGHASELLVSLVRAVGGDAYMCGGGASGYQDDALFADAGVTLIYQNFVSPSYVQQGVSAFASGLSIVDALMAAGLDGVRELLGRGKP